MRFSRMSHKKIGPDRFSRFDVYWIQTDRHTDKPNLYIDCIVKIRINSFMKIFFTSFFNSFSPSLNYKIKK